MEGITSENNKWKESCVCLNVHEDQQQDGKHGRIKIKPTPPVRTSSDIQIIEASDQRAVGVGAATSAEQQEGQTEFPAEGYLS